LGLAIIDKCEQDDAFYKGIQKALWIERKRVHKPSAWVAPGDGKMKIDDARALMPLECDKKAPAPKKKKAPAKKAAASAQPTADVVETPVIPEAPAEVQHAEIPPGIPAAEAIQAPPTLPAIASRPPRRRGNG